MVVIHSLHHLLMHAGSDGDVSVSPIHVQLYMNVSIRVKVIYNSRSECLSLSQVCLMFSLFPACSVLLELMECTTTYTLVAISLGA